MTIQITLSDAPFYIIGIALVVGAVWFLIRRKNTKPSNANKAVPVNVTKLISTSFHAARSKYGTLNQSWIAASFSIGGRLPHSLLTASVQRDGELDPVLRCMEDEQALLALKETDDNQFGFHYQKMLSELWVGSLYETLRLLIERKLAPSNDKFKRLAHEFRLLRIPLEKHELAGDDRLTEPLVMQRLPAKGDNSDYYTYPKGRDPTRAHIMPSGISARGSVMWQVIDLHTSTSIWLERRHLADRFLSLWQSTTQSSQS